ncbi:MAG: excinuclease ABC subunit UvrA [Planctomycetota bacterium]
MNRRTKSISLRQVQVNNLQHLDLEIPHNQWLGICGRSGAGKSSLAFDTLYAEGQRRYIESFSATARQFLAQVERPAAESITGVPPAIAVRNQRQRYHNRSTVGTATETIEYLRLLFARLATITCQTCQLPVRRESPASIARELESLPAGTRYQISFRLGASLPLEELELARLEPAQVSAAVLKHLRQLGFARLLGPGLAVDTGSWPSELALSDLPQLEIVVDRLAVGKTEPQRLLDSLETALRFGKDEAAVWLSPPQAAESAPQSRISAGGQDWIVRRFSRRLQCTGCGTLYPDPDPRLFSFNDPSGACPTCEGFGLESFVDEAKLVPDPNLSLREGAIAPWNSPSYRHELEELLNLADEYQLPVDKPWRQLTAKQRQLVWDGVPARDFGGIHGFLRWLERRKYKLHLRVFLARWKSYRQCPTCHGQRLNPRALSYRVGGLDIAAFSDLDCRAAIDLCESLDLGSAEAALGRPILAQLLARLRYLHDVGLGYLSLARPMNTLSRGELQRTTLTSSLSSTLVNMLYVIDEPSLGLHPADLPPLVAALRRLHQRGNTLVMVEHLPELLLETERLVELGPESGPRGGRIVFDGPPEELATARESVTGQYLRGERGQTETANPTPPKRFLRLSGARGLHLKNLDVAFPLGALCVVTGVSGAGKSTLVERTLFPALLRQFGENANDCLPYDQLSGWEGLEEVHWVDQSPLARSSRSNPVTYIKAFDEIRQVFAETPDAVSRNLTAGHFSFNVDGGRCPKCEGSGELTIDMQFLADVTMSCDECHGARYRPEVLLAKYRGKNINEVLQLTVNEAFGFFRGQRKLQTALKALMDVGLDYLQLGQSAATLSAGESQRLKLAAQLVSRGRKRSLFLLDHPCAGLHPVDIVRLLDCLHSLIAVGHSLIVMDHRLQLLAAADWLIELGPGAADQGGQLLAAGPPQELADSAQTATGQALRRYLAGDRKMSGPPASPQALTAAGGAPKRSSAKKGSRNQ